MRRTEKLQMLGKSKFRLRGMFHRFAVFVLLLYYQIILVHTIITHTILHFLVLFFALFESES